MKVAIIPARGGSKRIPRKNIKPFCGKPMIAWSIEASLQSGCFDRVIVSTADAAGFDIDNYVNVGTDGERNNTGNHSVAKCRRIIGKTVIDKQY